MIRVKLLSEMECLSMRRDQVYCKYSEDLFYDLLREVGDFTDEASCQLLRYLHGDGAVEGKWYRRTTPEGKPCLPAISGEAKYGLTVIANSRNGVYTGMVKDFTEDEVEGRMDGVACSQSGIPMVWDALAALDMDILLAFRKKDFSFGWDIPLQNDFILENYPGEDGPAPVWVRQGHFGKETECNGMRCVNNFFYDEQYDWRKEPGELLKLLEEANRGTVPLAKGRFSFPEFRGMLGLREWPYWDRAYDGALDDWEDEDEALRVFNHMEYLPDGTESRRLQYLIIDKYKDGHYRLRSEISVKYPEYDELLDEAKDFAIADGETLVLPVDVEEVLMCARDIRMAVCAFRVAGHVIETFDRREGLLEFGALLREAVDSGRCTVEKRD